MIYKLILLVSNTYFSFKIYTWARKAQTGGFQLIPLPADPFALPHILKSDPLRGPVFVPLNLECLIPDGKTSLFYGMIFIISVFF